MKKFLSNICFLSLLLVGFVCCKSTSQLSDEHREPLILPLSVDSLITYHEGVVWNPVPRDMPHSDILVNSDKEPKQYERMFEMKYTQNGRIRPNKKLIFPINHTAPTLITIKARANMVEPKFFLAEIYSENSDQPIWSKEAENFKTSAVIISGQKMISQEMINKSDDWRIVFSNKGKRKIDVEVWIATVDLINNNQ